MNTDEDIAGATRLVADLGGTSARFALVDRAGMLRHVTTLACDDFAGPAEAIRHYLAHAGSPTIRLAAIAVATAVVDDRVALTNRRDWSFSVTALRDELGLERLEVLNDFAALALSLPRLGANAVRQVGAGQGDPNAARAVLGPGTGLGVSGLVAHAGGWTALAGEGGHVTFSPADLEETEILRVLLRRFGHVSAERLLSGPGLVNIHQAQAEIAGESAAALAPAEITRRALDGSDALCGRTLAAFCAMLGTAAANLVLTLGARGGVYIGGGIVPRLGAFFDQSDFRARFEDRGRLSSYLAEVPSYVIRAETPALEGAAAALAKAQ